MKHALTIALALVLFSSFANAEIMTFYPDADPETTSVDGFLQAYNIAGTDWASLVEGTSQQAYDSPGQSYPVMLNSDDETDKWNYIGRAIFVFDTSSLPDDATISAATLSLRSSARSCDGDYPDMSIYSSNPASNTGLVGADYDTFGTTSFSTTINCPSWSTSKYNDFVLNSAGLAAISKTGVSKFGLREATHDAGGTAPTWSANLDKRIYVYYSEYGEGYKPKLVVIYTSAEDPPQRSNASPSGTLPAGTTQATISLTTNEDATCRYSTVAGTAYDSMPNTFSTTGGTSHSSIVTGLTDGSSYTYYVRCQDLIGNPNTDDFPISFSVATVDTSPPVISNIQAMSITDNSATITWTTDDQSTSVVDYGLTTSFGSTQSDTNLVTSHSVSLMGLSSSTTYYYKVRSCNSDNYCADSATYDFTTVMPTTTDSTIVGTISLIPTFESIGVTVAYTNDNNQNNGAVLQYRVPGGSWKTAPEMYVDRADYEYRGSIFWLTANTNYEVRVTFADPDGVSGNPVTAATKTRDDNPAIGTHYYYVSTTGSDSNPGTLAGPFRTIQTAANIVSPGDTILIRGGTYIESVSLTKSGAPDNYITFMPYNNEDVTISGDGTLGILFYTDDVSYVRIKGLNFENSLYPGCLFDVSHDIIVEDCTFYNCHTSSDYSSLYGSITIRGNTNDASSYNFLIQNNDIELTGLSGNLSSGVGAIRARHGTVVRNNVFRSGDYSLWDGISTWPEDEGGAENYLESWDIYDNEIYRCSDDGLQLEGGNKNMRIWGNYIEDSDIGIANCPVLEGPAYIFRNIVWFDAGYTNTKATKIGKQTTGYGRLYYYHNTFYILDGNNGITQTNSDIGNIVSKNNLVYATRYVVELTSNPAVSCDFDYDFLYTNDPARFVKWGSSGGSTLEQFQTNTGQELHGISAPKDCPLCVKFIDPVNGDFHLQSDSPCIDNGVVLPGFNDANSPWPYRGSAPDLGAYEYDSGAPTTSTTTTTTTTTIPACTISAASITPNCGGGVSSYCEEGETISMSGTISGDCSAVDFFQIDADSGCDIQYDGGDMQGIFDATPTIGSTISGTWTIPQVPLACQGVTVTGTGAGLYDGGPPDTGVNVAFTSSVSGSVRFAVVGGTTTTTSSTTTTIPGLYNQLVFQGRVHRNNAAQDACNACTITIKVLSVSGTTTTNSNGDFALTLPVSVNPGVHRVHMTIEKDGGKTVIIRAVNV